jgi:ribose 5-phosphate isomerase B
MIYLGADHGGFALKEKIKGLLKQRKKDFHDMGTFSEESCDYPDIALMTAEKVAQTKSLGILCCGTGIGMSIAANKVKGIRAAVCWNEFTAEMARKHNNANILCLGSRVIDHDLALRLVDIFLNAEFEGARHERRVCMITEYEK